MKPQRPTFPDFTAAERSQMRARAAVKAADERQEEKENPLPRCFVCDASLVTTGPPEWGHPVPASHATFSSSGGPNSAAWDPAMGGLRLEIAICDKCILDRAKRARVRHALSNGYRYGEWIVEEDPQTTVERLTKETPR